jgi:hypothetical protein
VTIALTGYVMTALLTGQLLLGAAAIGLAVAWWARVALHGRGRTGWTPVYLLIVCLIGGGWWILVAPLQPAVLLAGPSHDREMAVPVRLGLAVAMLLVPAAAMCASVAFWDRFRYHGRRDATRGLVRLLPVTGLCLPLAWLIGAVMLGESVDVDRSAGMAFYLEGAGILVVAGVAVGGLARGLANRGTERVASILIAAVLTVIVAVVSYPILSIADTGWQYKLRLLLGADPDATSLRLFPHWCVVVVAAVFTTAAGGAWGLRLGPRPKLLMPKVRTKRLRHLSGR